MPSGKRNVTTLFRKYSKWKLMKRHSLFMSDWWYTAKYEKRAWWEFLFYNMILQLLPGENMSCFRVIWRTLFLLHLAYIWCFFCCLHCILARYQSFYFHRFIKIRDTVNIDVSASDVSFSLSLYIGQYNLVYYYCHILSHDHDPNLFLEVTNTIPAFSKD